MTQHEQRELMVALSEIEKMLSAIEQRMVEINNLIKQARQVLDNAWASLPGTPTPEAPKAKTGQRRRFWRYVGFSRHAT